MSRHISAVFQIPLHLSPVLTARGSRQDFVCILSLDLFDTVY